MNKTIKHILFIVLILCVKEISHAQIKTNVSFSDSRLEKAKQMNKTRKEYKRHLKDSLKSIKKLNKQFDFKMDSLVKQMEKEAEQRAGLDLPYSADTLNNINLDSLKTDPGNLTKEEYERRKAAYAEKYGIDSLGNYKPWKEDSLLYKQQKRVTNAFEAKALEASGIGNIAQPPALPEGENPLETHKPNFDRFKQGKTLKNNMDKFPKVNLDKLNTSLNDAHKNMGDLKKKYASLPSMDDLKGGLKLNSLKGQPMGKRIKVGGSFTILQKDNDINVDFSPSVAYRLNRKWSTGIEGMYRTQFGNGRNIGNSFFSADTYGGRLFNEYLFIKSIYARAEFETLSTQVESIQDNSSTTEIVLGAMAGIGNSFTLTESLNGKINIQYNFLHDDSNPVYSSPWVIRFGLEFKKKNK